MRYYLAGNNEIVNRNLFRLVLIYNIQAIFWVNDYGMIIYCFIQLNIKSKYLFKSAITNKLSDRRF